MTLGSYLRLLPHPFSSLPAHPSLDSSSSSSSSSSSFASRPPLRSFLLALLTEAQNLLASIPSTFHPNRKPRRASPSTAKVQLSTCSIPHPNSPSTPDYWVCRQSVHEDAPVAGSASWKEFRSGLREHHSEHEKEYTPSVTAVERLLEWPSETDIGVNLITHTFHPTALIAPRSFIVLVVSADRDRDDGFVTIQIPLAADSSPESIRQKITTSAPRNAIFASYASVEEVVAASEGLQWTMATTSDAGGAIPQWVQRSWTMGGVPRAVVADVGLFLGWTARRRA
ncbi:hypothetical protein ASPCADRAFT_7253 [Aspergillus carbonarius ITEM 5010]|uniref:DUF3074 domain-containing protein n=1 Tax=Aspergillus carbonarius (strain ITEM 5010) TaxID=602072 RepID=A0A1R3RGT6_ASPC5|nr:hypothetical protein ASPCADRAFT_7160 [Aspergillus carbonarius ITEM 5010]OOF93766.1 hypothetical protein ASPCADRAFT_7253 [Aspergillus carbonarius ITEM 5010]